MSRKSATSNRLNLPGKLSDCTSPGKAGSELFVVEGDSAGGSAKQGRDRARQAILPLRGKVLNVESAPLAKVLENKELSDLVTALGCGFGKTFDLARLRYDRVIILADADADGNHIATLLLTFLYRHLPRLITSGKVFLAQPPLYRIDAGKQTHWALDDRQRDATLAAVAKGNGRVRPEVTRFKGLGEMMPKVLWETTLNPKTRRLLRVDVADQIRTDRVIADLMGRDASARFRFIMDRAEGRRLRDPAGHAAEDPGCGLDGQAVRRRRWRCPDVDLEVLLARVAESRTSSVPRASCPPRRWRCALSTGPCGRGGGRGGSVRASRRVGPSRRGDGGPVRIARELRSVNGRNAGPEDEDACLAPETEGRPPVGPAQYDFRPGWRSSTGAPSRSSPSRLDVHRSSGRATASHRSRGLVRRRRLGRRVGRRAAPRPAPDPTVRVPRDARGPAGAGTGWSGTTSASATSASR